ncbi:aminotransferase class V-fold PLP-dependent enzyme [Rhizobium lentis]|uniref:Cysteine desulfurase/selenocysteine lyase n=1 Tax=Rhizobium binae TaxID=1138190 RepID=A0ABV2MVR0_9HYPH|nr:MULTISPECIES: aminotransferase class V-fold PLP-dependent enzyme [Rhizobium]MBX4927146.1 aminotransferase class V-fold PLP-dependent enzyme [Rhizobium binae]MBX4996119.1 aminotransferase class V-fold PLP-dependent enzyme [Rhizobium binae]MBX5082631.1 aminotransferase class V-fold PLP-dependent enzyme [Rhizobium lentis]MBX5096228.1 aminotransferase class V-fold PLP-dependent enzyme [Rhizobium lentis]MBX5124188.1 aminotransferase class V-fold PLP-dependent enzyme [Rhizobium lentis]
MRKVFEDFPLLRRTVDGHPIIYLDSAATSLKPNAVIDAEANYARSLGANVHRGVSGLSSETTLNYERARRRVASFINTDADLVVFTLNATFAMGMVAHGLPTGSGRRALVSSNSHHSNLLPWRERFDVQFVGSDPLSPLSVEEVCDAVERWRPDVLAINWVSNVNGSVNPVAQICAAVRDLGVVTVVDAAQAIPHLKVNVAALQCDFLVFSGHKMLGPAGTGVLWGRREQLEQLRPLVLGGGTVASVDLGGYELRPLPYRLEPGTPNIGGALGLAAAIDYLDSFEENMLLEHQASLSLEIENIFSSLRGVKIFGPFDGATHLPIVSLLSTVDGISADVLCRTISDSSSVMTRSGLHCAHPIFQHYRQMGGAVRISAYLYNSPAEIRLAADALERAMHPFFGR